MAIEDTKANLSIKVSHQDMLDYTDDLYVDIADPAINGINTHSADESPHNLPARFSAVYDEIDRLDTELAGKLGNGSIDLAGKADVAGDEFTGTVTFSAADEAVIIDGDPNTDRAIRGKTAGINRWEIAVASNDNELGSNRGSNLVVNRYADNGLYIDSPFGVDRETGTVYVNALQVGGGGITYGQGIDVRVQEVEPVDNLVVGTVWLKPSGTVGGPAIGNIPTYGLISYIQASSLTGIVVDGGTFGTVPDSSGGVNPASSYGTGAPVYSEDETPLGGPIIRGDNDGYLKFPTTMYTGKTAGHVFAYIYTNMNNSGDLHGPWVMGTADSINQAALTNVEGAFSSTSGSYSPVPQTRDAWRIYEVSSVASVNKVFIDGTLQLQRSAGFVAPTAPALLRSASSTSSGTVWKLADFVAYDRALTDIEAAEVRQYLIDKNGPTG